MKIWRQLSGFDWDQGNAKKSLMKHGITAQEAEEIFFNQPLLVAETRKHQAAEQRFFALGKTHRGKRLFVVFTVRHSKIRPISCRPMSRKERSVYEQETHT